MQNGCDFIHHAIDSLLLHGLSVWPKWKILVNRTKGEALAGVTHRNMDLNGGGKAPTIRLVHCLGGSRANAGAPRQRQL